MDNPETGDVSFEARGKRYTLRYTTAAFVSLEAHLDRGIFDIYEELATWSPQFDPKTKKPVPESDEQTLARIRKLRVGFMRALFWAGFHDLHRDVTVDEAGEIMKEIGGMMAAYRLVVEGISAAQQPPQAEAAGRPPKRSAKGQTG